MKIRVHVEGIKGSGLIEKGDQASALFRGVLEIDGHLIEEVSSIEAVFSGDSFVTVKANLIPGSFEVVTHDKESWPQLLQQLENKEIRAGQGQLLGVSPGLDEE